jgi:hypothetical protein
MRSRLRIAAALLGVVGTLAVTLVAARPVDAQWLDREVTSATFRAKTIPAPLLAGTSPYCSWNSVVTTTALVFTWAPPAGYASTSIRITAQKGTATQVVTGATTTSSGGVYTTTVPVSLLNAIGSLLGGTIVLHLATVDAPSGWLSTSADYSWTMSLAGIAVGCSAKPAP